MTDSPPALPSRSVEWQELFASAAAVRAERNARPPASGSSIEACGIRLDVSRQLLGSDMLERLHDLARTRGIEKRRDAMFAGEMVNASERRAALHVALRADDPSAFGSDVAQRVNLSRERMRQLADKLHGARPPITDIVNIGIGGSDFGARLLCEALRDRAPAYLRVHFVASVDAVQIDRLQRAVNPRTALFIVSSKSFSTVETLLNAKTLLAWFRRSSPDVAKHWFAVTGNAAAAIALGVPADNVLDVPDWVGGRFSAWGAVGLPAALYLGWPAYSAWLGGGAAMDEHHRTAPLERNLPVRLALLNVWNTSFLGSPSHCIVSYDNRLAEFLTWAQQLEMESNGKSTTADGLVVDYPTAPIVWGGLGNSGQHTYFQLLREGTVRNAITMITVDDASAAVAEHAAALAAQADAQAEALTTGASAGRNSLTRVHVANLEARTLGSLMACFEHATTVAGWIWGLNSFDQPGVELGKKLAAERVSAR